MKDPTSPHAGVSRHFRREAKLMLWGLGALPLGLAMLALWPGPLLLEHIDAGRRIKAADTAPQENGRCERRQRLKM